MQATPEKAAPPGLIYDGQMRGEPHDLLAVATALSLSMLEEPASDMLTFSLTGSGLAGAAFVEAAWRFYTMAHLRDYPEEFRRYRGLPIGLDDGGDVAAKWPALTRALSRTLASGEPAYPHEVFALTDTADPAALIRNGLTAAEDQSVVVVLNGPATNLASVLELNGGRELIEAKVKRLVAALGDPPHARPDAHLRADRAAAAALLSDWPTEIVLAPLGLSEIVRLPEEALEAGFDWAAAHLIRDALEATDADPPGVGAREALAALYAVDPTMEGLELSEPAQARVGGSGGLVFEPDSDGRRRYLRVAPARSASLERRLLAVASAEPAARELPEFLKRFLDKEKEADRRAQ